MRARAWIVAGLLALFVAPLAGGLAAGLPPAFLEFPPLTRYVRHAPFSGPVFAFYSAAALLMLLVLVRPRLLGFRPTGDHSLESAIGNRQSEMPWWFWFGLVLNLLSWVGAWGRFAWLGFVADHLFFALWLGYILAIDGLVRFRTGSSVLSRSPRTFVFLFPASAAAWWYFEYLNRFVQNWWYEGVNGFSGPHYAAFATLCFSTVLPAVFETAELLSSFRWFQTAYAGGRPWRPPPRAALIAIAAGGAAGLALMAHFPNPLFAVTWLAPLAVLGGTLALAGSAGPFEGLGRGDGRRLLTLAAAALVCGFFWEMWNFYSWPKWHYSVPYVNQWHVFEMPLPGYAGYLPFGPICWCLWEAMARLLGGGRPDEAILRPRS